MAYASKDEREVATSKLSSAAREAMKEWKEKNKIKAILPKTKNQRAEIKLYNKIVRKKDAHERRKISTGAASEVRKVDPNE